MTEPRFHPMPVPRPLLAGAAALLLALAVWSLSRALPTPGLLDFGSFVASGRAASEGLDPYGIYPLTFHVVLPGFESWNPNLNPPAALPLFQAFDWFEPHQAFRHWWSLSVASFALGIALLARAYRPRDWVLPVLWAAALAGLWDTLVLGQIYLPLALAGFLGWLCLDRNRPILAGLAIALVVSVKPNFLVWPALLFLAGHWRAPVAMGVAAVLLALLPALLYGPEVYLQWAQLVASDAERARFLTNASLAGILERVGLSGAIPLAVNLAILAGLALWAFLKKPSVLHASAVGLAGSLVASPLAWVHYALLLVPVFFAGPLNPWLLFAATAFLVPVPAVLTLMNADPALQASLGSVYGWAALACLIGTLSMKEVRSG